METNTVLLLVLLAMSVVGHIAQLLATIFLVTRSPIEVNANAEATAVPEVGTKNYLQQPPPDAAPTDDALLDDMTEADYWKNGEPPPWERE